MPRVWHQPSLGKENIWMFHHLEHERCLGTRFLLLQFVTGATQCWGFEVRHGYPVVPNMVWSPVTFDTLLFSFYYSSDSSFLCRRSSHHWAGHPTVRGLTVWQLAHSVYLCSCWLFNQDHFILRYARYAIKSDYLNLIFEACSRFFYLTSYLKQK